MGAFVKLAYTEFKLTLREPIGVFFTLLFPLMLLVLFGSVYGNSPVPELGGLGAVDLSVPGYIAMIIGTVGMIGLPITLSSYRENGILRRLRATPVTPLAILGAQVVVNVLLTILGAIPLLLVGRLMFDVRLPSVPLSLGLAIGLSAISFFSISFVLAGVLPTARSAQAVGMALFYPMLFLSGATLPRELMPELLQRISSFLPLTHVVTLLQGLWFGQGWNITSLAVLGGILLVGTLVSSRMFRWE